MKPTIFLLVVLLGSTQVDPSQEEAPPRHETPYRIVNVHRHCWSPDEALLKAELEAMSRSGVAKVVVLDGGQSYTSLPAWISLKEKYSDRLVVFGNIDFGANERIADTERFFAQIVEELETQARLGVQGVKIYKTLGMSVREPSGKLLAADDPRLDPFWDKCGELGLPVLLHMADPKEYWDRASYNAMHYGLLTDDKRYYGDPNMPEWEELIGQRDHIVEKHPHTTFIGAHMGSLTMDLDRLADTFEKYPNFYVDCSARLRILGRLNPVAVHDFMVKYQDRILFGTDDAFSLEIDEASRMYDNYRAYFETDRTDIKPPLGQANLDWLRLAGVGLPPEVLEKLYHLNAERLIPGLRLP